MWHYEEPLRNNKNLKTCLGVGLDLSPTSVSEAGNLNISGFWITKRIRGAQSNNLGRVLREANEPVMKKGCWVFPGQPICCFGMMTRPVQ